MLPKPPPQAWEDDYRFHRLLVECLEELESGHEVDVEKLTERWPQFREPVENFLADREALLGSLESPLAGHLPPCASAPKRKRCGDRVAAAGKSLTERYPEPTLASQGSRDIEIDDGLAKLPKLIGQYHIEDEVARGGMGVVYRARQQGVERTVALKMILTGRLATTADVDRFKREVCAAGNLIHPNIVRIHEAGRVAEQPFFTMDFINGPSLAEKLAEGSIPAREAAALTETLARAIDYAHRCGVVHRDLKPANILLDRSGTPHVSDFGLAKLLTRFSVNAEDLTHTGQILGTPGYMSPEQAVGKPQLITESTDIYSLGAILYACLTGRAPFVADTTLETLTQVVHSEPVSIRLLNPDVPVDLETICLRCLRKEPSQRYPTADSLAEDLQRFRKGLPIEARRTGPLTHFGKWCRRRPDAAALLASLTMVVAVAFCAIAYWWVQAVDAKTIAEEASVESNQHLVESLFGQASATRVARQSGYRQEVWDLLQQLLTVPEVAHDKQRVRQEAVLCLGDFVGDQSITIGGLAPLRSNDYALFLDDSRIVIGEQGGDISIRDLETEDEVSRITRYGSPVAAACVLNTKFESIVLADRSHLERWDRHPRGVWTRSWQTPARFPDHFVPLSHANDRVFFADGPTIRVVSAQTGKTLFSLEVTSESPFQKMPSKLQAVAVSHDGHFVAAAETSDEIFVWNTLERKLIRRLRPESTGTPHLEFDSHDDFLIIGSNEGVVIYGCDRFEVWSRIPTEAVKSLSTSSTEQKLLILTQTGNVELWDLHSQACLAKLNHAGDVKNGACANFSPSGHRFLSSHADQIRIWDLRGSGEKISLRAHRQTVRQIAYSVSGERMASGGRDGLIHFWDSRSGRLIGSPLDLQEPIESLEFSDCGRWFAAVTRRSLHLYLWNTTSPVRVDSLHFPSRALQDLCFDQQGKSLVVTGLGHTDIWMIEPGSQDDLPTLKLSKSCDSGGQSVILDDRRQIILVQTDREVLSMSVLSANLQRGDAIPAACRSSICRTQDSSVFFAVAHNGDIERIDPAAGRRSVVARRVQCSPTASLSVAPSGVCAALTHDSFSVALYDLQSGEIIFKLPPMPAAISTLQWRCDSRQLAIGLADGGIVLWNLDWVADELKAAGLWGTQPLWYRPLEPSQRPTVAARQQQWDLVDRELVGRKRIEQLLKQWAVPDLDAASFDQNSYAAPLILEQIREAQGAITETEAITLRLPIEQLKSLSSELRLSGYHIASLHPYRTDGNVYFAALWKRLTQSTEFRLDLAESELHRTIDSMKRSGYVVCDFGGYLAGHPELSLRHFAIFEPAEQGQLQSRTIQIEAASDLNNEAANAGPTDKQVFTSHLCFDLLDRPYRCTVFESVESAGQPRVVETLSENEFREQANRFAQQRVYRLNATRDRVTGRLVFHVVTGATGSSNLRPLLCHEPIDLSRDVVRRMMQVGYKPTQLAVTDDGHATIFFDLPGTSSSRQEGTQGNWTDI